VQRNSPENSLPSQLFAHFGLQENPFGVTPDIRFLYQSHTHHEALTSLINGIDFGFGFQVLIGQPGMGKTSLLFSLLEKFRTAAHTAFVFQPQSEPHDLLQSVLYELGTSSAETSLHKLFEQVNDVLYSAAQERKRVILVVDEAQNLDLVVLEALRQLSNFETPDAKLVQVVLAGQPQLAEKLAASTHEQLRQRISAISRLRPLGLDETDAYIHHRLTTAGYGGVDLFTEGGARLIWNHSKGIPRNINTLCFAAMILAFEARAKSIDERILEEAARNLDLNSALADVLEMPPPVAGFRGNGEVQTGGKLTTPETDYASAVANEEPPVSVSATTTQQETEAVAASAGMGDGDTDTVNQMPPSVVEALARIAQALEEQKLLLMAKSDASSQPPSSSPVIPLYCTAERTETPASTESTPGLLFSSAIRPSSAAAIPEDKTEELETNSTGTSAPRKEVRPERKTGSDIAPEHEEKARANRSFSSNPPAVSGFPPTEKKDGGSRKVWTKALSLAAFAAILALMLFEKFPLLLGTVKAGVPGRSAAVQPVGYSVPTARSPESLIATPGTPDRRKATDFHASRAHVSNQSRDVVVWKFSTDLGVTSKNSDNKPELRRIFFNEDSDLIDSQYRPWLRQIAEALANDPKAMVSLEGHTDDRGGEAHNQRLSSLRAIAVRNVLVNELHVPKTRLVASGAGSDAPLQPNSSAAGRAYNRRVEVRLTHSGD
jgi:type II secretory pathway predicted ATPase ExeA/outer membrane protein OmpA-like peptidoglycan-associated protein